MLNPGRYSVAAEMGVVVRRGLIVAEIGEHVGTSVAASTVDVEQDPHRLIALDRRIVDPGFGCFS